MKRITLTFLALLLAGWFNLALAAVTVEGDASGGVIGGISISFAVQCGVSANRLIIGANAINSQTETSSTVTYNGVGLGLKKRNLFTGISNTAELWFLAAPATGSNNLVFTISGSTNAAAVGFCVSDADQSSPLGTEAFDTQLAELISVNATGVANGLIVDLLAKAGTAVAATVGAGQTQQESVDNGDTSIRAQVSSSTTVGVEAMNWTNTGDPSYLNQIAVPINPAGVAATVVKRQTIVVE